MSDKVIYILLLLILCSMGLTYSNLSEGLAAKTFGGPFYCNDLLSSGGDDTILVDVFSLFVIPLVVRLVLLRRDISVIEVALFYAIATISCFSLYLASLDCAEIFYTAFQIPDPYLAIGLITLPVSAIMLWLIRSKSRK